MSVIRDARAAIAERTTPKDLRDPAADREVRAFARELRASETGPRTLVAALRVLRALEAEHTAALAAAAQRARSRSAQAAGRARAAQVEHLDPKTVRAWAKAQGLDVPARGRYLPADVVAAYAEAHEASA